VVVVGFGGITVVVVDDRVVDGDALAAVDNNCCELHQSKQASIISLASGDQNDDV
jgi:hypothetical protein